LAFRLIQALPGRARLSSILFVEMSPLHRAGEECRLVELLLRHEESQQANNDLLSRASPAALLRALCAR
jgi:hypothetical protein